jgi:chemotaxis protein methyltransferase CheR
MGNNFQNQCSLKLDANEYDILKRMLSQKTGIDIGESKQTLVESRLLRRLTELGCTNYSDYIEILKTNSEEGGKFINSMTTNKTNWFREPAHFEYLSKIVVPLHTRIHQRPIYIWSAAASTGEEIYTLAMVLSELQHTGLEFRILGTDIDTQVIATAENAIYKGITVREEVAPHLVAKYFRKELDTEREELKVSEQLLAKVKFRQFNLISSSLIGEMKFDVIFLRNVLIYFKANTIETVINRLCSYLNPGGHLFIGHSETLHGIRHPLQAVGPSIFRMPG